MLAETSFQCLQHFLSSQNNFLFLSTSQETSKKSKQEKKSCVEGGEDEDIKGLLHNISIHIFMAAAKKKVE
jgi:hypothetical protein